MQSKEWAKRRHIWGISTAVLGLTLGFAGANPTVRGDAKPQAEKVDPQVAEFFETKIRPVLADNCYGCHGPASQMAKLRVDSKAALLKGGESGPAIVGNDPAKSLLIQVVHHNGKIKMPPGGKLKDEEIAALEEWVKLGAPWPGADVSAAALAAVKTGEYVITPEQRRFWSFQPVKKPALPAVRNTAWAASPIDRFILARLEAKQIKPNPPVDRRTLIRRATFDLHGLPPTPAEVEAFLRDKSPNAWEKVVDRLLASPRYGERWGRHWLDVARYADTKGYVFVEDRNYPFAYNYRDWVIRAFNDDLPYDQFITQQIAADRLPLGEDKRPLAALGFLTVGRRFLNNSHDIIDDRIDVTMRGFQGLTTACARCHDHKFDPISTKDYYALYGVFASSVEPPPIPISPKQISEPYAAHDKRVKDVESEERNLVMAQVKILRERVEKKEALPEPVKDALQQTRPNDRPRPEDLAKLEPHFTPETADKLKSLRETLEQLRKSYPPKPEMAMTLADAPQPVTPRVFRRGNPGNPGDEVPRRFHTILAKGEPQPWTNGSGRLELARAIASKSNPLTARVMVNRIWLQHFGLGLVRTPSDFGKQGERPTHPELLDYLAWRFMNDGWSVKRMHRLIMLSSTYRQSSATNPAAFAKDPENRLVWRMNRRRLELEALRDSLLAAAGRLDLKIGGPSVELWQAPFTRRRTVYGFIERQNLPGIFRTFDFASPDATSPQRYRTTVPQQALFLMNSPFVVEQAQSLANRPDLQARKDDASRVRYLYYLLYGRQPDAGELKLGLAYLRAAAAPSTPPTRPSAVWRYGWGAYDDAAKRVVSFTPLAVFKDNGWQGGRKFPDPELQFLRLTPTGGHPGVDARHAAIRRWVAPQDGIVSIRATLGHGHVGSGQGDGIEARVVSSREGLLGVWTAHNAKQETVVDRVRVKKGDTIDFVVSPRAAHDFDSFLWSPNITLEGGKVSWNANSQFHGDRDDATPKPLSAWERYAQALLMTNEFFFVD